VIPAAAARRLVTAWHEAGHAVATHRLGGIVRRVTIVPTDDFGGRASGDIPAAPVAQLQVLAAGLVAAALRFPEARFSVAGNDFDKIGRLTAGVPDEHRPALMQAIFDDTAELLRRHWADVDRLAGLLLEHGTIVFRRDPGAGEL
jgi:hypothetical protein